VSRRRRLERAGGAYSAARLNVSAVFDWSRDNGSVVGAPTTETITNEELVELDVDVLVPAALDRVVTLENAITHQFRRTRTRG
jgi:glutamate dehydrogenase (NAD(P)+)